MTIKDIAKQAQVSVSTVSKIINNKDQHIREETRERVLKIIKQNNYTPYSKQISLSTRSSLLLGVLVQGKADEALLYSVIQTARLRGYSAVVCICEDKTQEQQSLAALLSHRVDGLLYCGAKAHTSSTLDTLKKEQLPYFILGGSLPAGSKHLTLPITEYMTHAIRHLVQLGHTKIGYLTDKKSGGDEVKFFSAFKTQAETLGIALSNNDRFILENKDHFSFFLESHTAIICHGFHCAQTACRHGASINLQIPRDLSLLAIGTPPEDFGALPFGWIAKDYAALGAKGTSLLVDQIEHRKSTVNNVSPHIQIQNQEALQGPHTRTKANILVVGAANIDTLCRVDRQPALGETFKVSSQVIVPGGKGVNQALAAAKLGADTALITSMGKDHDGGEIHAYLKEAKVNTDGVFARDNQSTGQAYIQIEKEGESRISVFPAANRLLSPEDIAANADLFKSAGFCLLQTELPQSTVAAAAKLSKAHGAKVILKPCSVLSVEKDLLQYVDFLIPNRREAAALLPEISSVEQQAEHFYQMGIPAVIITLGRHGCYLKDQQHTRFFPGLVVDSVDTTGAADGFIATLAVYLAMGYSILKAIGYASCAGSLVTTRYGVPSGLVDRKTLEMFADTQLQGWDSLQ